MAPVPPLDPAQTPTTPLQKSARQLQKLHFQLTDTPEDPKPEDSKPTARTLHLPEFGVKTNPPSTPELENPWTLKGLKTAPDPTKPLVDLIWFTALYQDINQIPHEHNPEFLPQLLSEWFIKNEPTLQQPAYNVHYPENNDRGVILAHAHSNDVLCCPVSAVPCQFLLHHSTFSCLNIPFNGTVKLASYCSSQQGNIPVGASMITHTIHVHAAALESITGIAPKNLSTRSLCTGEVVALLQGGCDPSVIKPMQYLQQQSFLVFQNLVAKMFNNGTYTFLPDKWVLVVPAVKPAQAV